MDFEECLLYYRTVEASLRDVLRTREEKMHVLVDICLEIQAVNRKFNRAHIVRKATSAVTGVASVVLLVTSPITGGLSAAGGQALAGVESTTAAMSLGETVYHNYREMTFKEVAIALDADRKTPERLRTTAGVLKDMATIAGDTSHFLFRAAQLVVTAAHEVNTVLKISNVSEKAIAIATKISVTTDNVNKVLNLTGPALLTLSIPLDILSLLTELKDCRDGNFSATADAVWKTVLDLQQEYTQAKEAFKDIVIMLEDVDGWLTVTIHLLY